MIGVDWGTTSFRAVRLRGRAVLDRRDLPLGILRVPPGGFAEALRGAVAPWLADGETRILIVRHGRQPPRLARGPLPPLPRQTPNATRRRPHPRPVRRRAGPASSPACPSLATPPEVMRGEETQLVGALDGIGPERPRLPPRQPLQMGHREPPAQITGFTTHLTGEAFAALRDHTILGRLIQPGAPPDPVAASPKASPAPPNRAASCTTCSASAPLACSTNCPTPNPTSPAC